MSLLDHTYEIISQRPLGEQHTLFEATAPDGSALHICWYDLLSPEEEARFERYRRLLKRLRDQGWAAIYDLVSRPGAHYVAWRAPVTAPRRASTQELEPLQQLLESYGYGLQAADVRAERAAAPKLYGLAFDGSAPLEPLAPQSQVAAPSQSQHQRIMALPAWLWAWLPGLLLALFGVGLLGLSFASLSNNRLVIVPKLEGEQVTAAATQLYRLGLAVDAQAAPSSQPAGVVLNVRPAVGAQVRPGHTVHLSYALPPGQLESAKVPELRGHQLSGDAETLLERAGLELGHITRIPANSPAGMVLAQSLSAGDVTAKGNAVDVLLSDGPLPKMTFLPDLTGLDVADATALAQLAGIGSIEQDHVAGASEAAGTVIKQGIAAATPIPEGSAVLYLTVAGGSDAIPQANGTAVPDLVGMSTAQAEQVAQQAGYRIDHVAEMATRSLPEGVVRQTPEPGSAAADKVVTVVVNVHPLVIPRPDISVEVRQLGYHILGYRWYIEPGIPQETAEVTATTSDGRHHLVVRKEVQGGDTLSGTYLALTSGPVTFTLTLGGIPYGDQLLVNPNP